MSLQLVVRRRIAASAARLFEAWTTPDQLRKWWGPATVTCIDAQVDLRVGGRYRIGNRLATGEVLWIGGEFEVVSPPDKLVYSWEIEPGSRGKERVSVTFEARGAETEVVVVHERIGDEAAREQHQDGWVGCLDKLAAFLAR